MTAAAAFDVETGTDVQPARGQTRFLIYPQVPHLAGYEKPETVFIKSAPGLVGPGPSDNRIYVSDPLFDKQPYEYPNMPPFSGDTYAPVEPGYDGHFDTVAVKSRQFLAAHAYACVRRVLDIWEGYIGRPVTWHFADAYERLEIIPFIDWDNAQSGYGYLELGYETGSGAGRFPYALNFDVIAHEIGHSILFSEIGLPAGQRMAGDFTPFHEANADLISLLSFMHFDTGLDRLLDGTGGNLLVLNELNRIAELSGDRQIRIACNYRKLSEVTDDVHDRSRPLTGAIFDTLVAGYHARLVAQNLADERLLEVDIKDIGRGELQGISDIMRRDYRARPFLYKRALTEARDEVALVVAEAWRDMDPNNIVFADFSHALVKRGNARAAAIGRRFEINLEWRELV